MQVDKCGAISCSFGCRWIDQTTMAFKATYGSQLVEGLEPSAGETILVESRCNASFATNLDLILHRQGITTVVVDSQVHCRDSIRCAGSSTHLNSSCCRRPLHHRSQLQKSDDLRVISVASKMLSEDGI